MRLYSALLDLLYPSSCYICNEPSPHLFCPSCFDVLSFGDPTLYCEGCFFQERGLDQLCSQCRILPQVVSTRAVLFPPTPASFSLDQLLARGNELLVYESIAALCVVHWGNLGWPMPDFVSVLPERGYERGLTSICRKIGDFFDKPTCFVYQLAWQAPFLWKVRKAKKSLGLEGKSILIVDRKTTMPNLREAINEIKPFCAENICILSLFDE